MNDKLTLDQIDVLVIDPDRTSRSTIRNILIDNGFRNISVGEGMADIFSKFQIGMPDLLIADIKIQDGNLNDFVYKLRHHEVGANPFLPIIATAWSPTGDDVRSIVQAGADDIIAKPLSAAQLLSRISMLIKARKPFVVTSHYIGPDRRKPGEEERGGVKLEQLKVPNVLRAKALGAKRLDQSIIQRQVDDFISKVNLQKLDRHAHQAIWLVERIVPGLAFGGPDEPTTRSLQRLLYVSEDISRRMVGTQYEHVSELCNSLLGVTQRILDAGDFPAPKDVDLLKPLANAIQRGFDEKDGDVAKTAHEIFESVAAKHN